jgi:hypothetical protein
LRNACNSFRLVSSTSTLTPWRVTSNERHPGIDVSPVCCFRA